MRTRFSLCLALVTMVAAASSPAPAAAERSVDSTTIVTPRAIDSVAIVDTAFAFTRGTMTTDSITSIAAVCHEANRMYCTALGDTSQPEWAQAPTWQRDSAVTGVRAIAEGRTTRPEQSHESWSAEKLASGWRYGPTKDAEAKTHPCLVPFEQLPREQQTKDHLFFAIASTLLAQL